MKVYGFKQFMVLLLELSKTAKLALDRLGSQKAFLYELNQNMGGRRVEPFLPPSRCSFYQGAYLPSLAWDLLLILHS